MNYNSLDIKRLLQALAAKTNKSLVRGHLQAMHDLMEKSDKKGLFSEDYLYRKIFLRVKDSDNKNNKSISLNTRNIEAIATFLGYTGYDQFIQLPDQSINALLENCVGSWYSYVRCNSGNEEVLISPVQIIRNGKEVIMKLNGPSRKFEGSLKLEGNCLYCLLESKSEKNIHLVFKVGFSQKPNVLQGVFSGMSTAGDPIAGREVLIRQELEFASLKNSRRSIAELVKSRSEEEKIIGGYFSDKEQNILKGGQASTFELNDLKKE